MGANAPLALNLVSFPFSANPGGIITGTLSHNGPPGTPVTVNLTSDEPGRGSVPASVDITAENNSVNFPITVPANATAGEFTVTASANGYTPSSTTLVVSIPPPPPPVPPASSITNGWKQGPAGYTIPVDALQEICFHIITDGFVGNVWFNAEPKDSNPASIPLKFTNIATGELVDSIQNFSQPTNLLRLVVPCMLKNVFLGISWTAGKIDVRKFTR